MAHSKVVGGSTAKRVIACPGSVALCAKMPPAPSSTYADKGTLLHTAMDAILSSSEFGPRNVIGMTYQGETLDEHLYDEKITPALEALDEIDPDQQMEYMTEAQVEFGELLPDVFGTTDVLGRRGRKAIVLDWKFGDGVPVSAEENSQLMFYAAAAMRTETTAWVFDKVDEVELIIVQPPHIRRWTTTVDRIREFEIALVLAVNLAQKPDAPLSHGDHCRWCNAKPICPRMTGAIDRALKVQIEALDAPSINAYLKAADVLEEWIKGIRALGFQMLEQGVQLPDWKIVQKRALRKWVNPEEAAKALDDMGIDPFKSEIVSPAQAEKLLKPLKLKLPDGLAVAESSGTTMASAEDPRPAVLQIGQQLTAALSKIV